MIYLDNAATGGKKPQKVISAVNEAMQNYNANPGRSGHNLSINAALKVYEARNRISDFFDADGAEKVVFTLNCTHALNYVIKGVLTKNDHVVISDLEHNAVMRPLNDVGVKYDVAEVSFVDDNVTVNNFRKLIREDTKMIICTAASNVFGKILPIKAIGEICRENNILFTVDAAQAAGIIPISMREMCIDYLCIAPHKALYSLTGIGILIANTNIDKTIIQGGTGSDSFNLNQPLIMPEMLESGTINLPGVFSIVAGMNFLKQIGMSKIYSNEISLTQKAYNGLLENDDIILYAPFPKKGDFAPVISFNIKNSTSEEVADFLNRNGICTRGGFHCAPFAHKKIKTENIGTVRISIGFFNSIGDIKVLLNVLKNFKKSKNFFI